jgi:hypothetical protein
MGAKQYRPKNRKQRNKKKMQDRKDTHDIAMTISPRLFLYTLTPQADPNKWESEGVLLSHGDCLNRYMELVSGYTDFKHVYEVKLKPIARILHIKNDADFSKILPQVGYLNVPDWSAFQKKYDGVLIDPAVLAPGFPMFPVWYTWELWQAWLWNPVIESIEELPFAAVPLFEGILPSERINRGWGKNISGITFSGSFSGA